jgi:hypothetical protein
VETIGGESLGSSRRKYLQHPPASSSSLSAGLKGDARTCDTSVSKMKRPKRAKPFFLRERGERNTPNLQVFVTIKRPEATNATARGKLLKPQFLIQLSP